MEKNKILEKVEALTLYTGTYGRKKCTCSCIGCTQGITSYRENEYQGDIEQIKKIIELLPNLKTAYILGNPDISVDTNFCNIAAKEFIKNGIKVMFSTSGYNGEEVAKELLEGLDRNMVEYISYSVDTLDNEKLHFLKGTKRINIEEVDKAIEYCIREGIPVKIQPTLWNVNQDDYKELIEYYEKKGIKWFTFHVGSFEGVKNEIPLKHIEPEKWDKINKEIKKIAQDKDLKIKVPKIFVDDDEKEIYKNQKKLYCQNGGTDIQIWLSKGIIKSSLCPILTAVYPEYIFDLEKEDIKLVNSNYEGCIVAERCIDNELRSKSKNNAGREFNVKDKKIYNMCRYYSDKAKYNS